MSDWVSEWVSDRAKTRTSSEQLVNNLSSASIESINLLESDLPDEPEREGFWPEGAEVAEAHEESDECPAHQGVADPRIESHLGDVPGEHRGLVEDEDKSQQNVEIAGETAILQLNQRSNVNLNIKLKNVSNRHSR